MNGKPARTTRGALSCSAYATCRKDTPGAKPAIVVAGNNKGEKIRIKPYDRGAGSTPRTGGRVRSCKPKSDPAALAACKAARQAVTALLDDEPTCLAWGRRQPRSVVAEVIRILFVEGMRLGGLPTLVTWQKASKERADTTLIIYRAILGAYLDAIPDRTVTTNDDKLVRDTTNLLGIKVDWPEEKAKAAAKKGKKTAGRRGRGRKSKSKSKGTRKPVRKTKLVATRDGDGNIRFARRAKVGKRT